MPALPTELWWHILRLSVHDPGLFETKWDHYTDDFIFLQGWERPYSKYCASLPTKLSICLVSRTWRVIGVELLYEHLVFTQRHIERKLSQVAEIFDKHADRMGYGRSTMRVDVPIEALVDPYPSPLFRLLESCHNLRIVGFIFPDYCDPLKGLPDLISLLQSRFSHSLRRLNFALDHERPESIYGRVLPLPEIPLDTLELPTGKFLPLDPPTAIMTVSTLILNFSSEFHELPTWQFPALRHLSLNRVRRLHAPAIRSFLVNYGPQLISLHIEGEMNDFSSLPRMLLLATQLRCLVVATLTSWLSAGSQLPGVTHLGLRYLRPSLSDIRAIVSSPSFPSLRCIRYLDYTNPEGKSMDSSDQTARESLVVLGKICNVRFEDQRGRLVSLDQTPSWAVNQDTSIKLYSFKNL